MDIKEPIKSVRGYHDTLDYICSKGFNFKQPKLDSNFFHNSRQIMVDYILWHSGSKLNSDEADWDSNYLPNLTYWLPRFLLYNKSDFLTLVDGSVQSNLVDRLLQSHTYGGYTNNLLKEMEDIGINLDLWLNDTESVSVEHSSFTFHPWSRDFRREYAIGSYSRCCIGIGEFSEYSYPPVLLEYFLDPSIKTIMVKDQDGNQVAQSYLLAAKDKKGEPVLVVTTLEHGFDEQEAQYMMLPLIESHIGENGFQSKYGFKRTVFHSRKNEFNNLKKFKKNELLTLNKQIRHLLNYKRPRKKHLKNELFGISKDVDGKEIVNIETELRRVSADIECINKNLKKNKKIIASLNPHEMYLSRLGHSDNLGYGWKGTKYLDAFEGFYQEEFGSHDNLLFRGFSFDNISKG